MKKINMASLLLLLSIVAAAQQPNRTTSPKDQLDYEGYTIRILPAIGAGYGYDIRKGKELVVHQSYNPFTMAPVGLRKKEDVYKLARWQIEQLQQDRPIGKNKPPVQGNLEKLPPALQQRLRLQGTLGPFINQPLPRKIAEELQIDYQH